MRHNYHSDLLLVGFLVALPALGVALYADQLWGVLRYDRNALMEGQWWRLLTAHWIHLSHQHLALNLGALVLMLVVLGRLLTPASLLLSTLLGALAVGLCLYSLSPDLYWYAGLSGVVSSIWGTAATRGARCGSWLGWAALLLLLTRILWEQLTGATPSIAIFIGGAVIVDAHLYGGLAGGLLGVLLPRLHAEPQPANAL